jgi:hypothetical protein
MSKVDSGLAPLAAEILREPAVNNMNADAIHIIIGIKP